MLLLTLKFTITAALILYCGRKLASHAETLSEHTGISTFFIGAIFLSIATSLPELAAAVSALWHIQSVALAAADLLGSVLLNLIVIPATFLLIGSGFVYHKIAKSNYRLLFGTVGMLAVVSVGKFLPVINIAVSRIGAASVLIAAIYFASLYYMRGYKLAVPASHSSGASRWQLWLTFCAYMVSIAVLGWYITLLCDEIAQATHLSHSFIGATLLAFATSLPEVTITVAALVSKNYNLGISNIIGSNAFNVFIFFLLDIIKRDMSIWGDLTPSNLLTALFAAGISVLLIAAGVFSGRIPRFLKNRAYTAGLLCIAVVAYYCIFSI